MALKTDDEDLRDVRFWMEVGGNGDYYLNLLEYPGKSNKEHKRINMRVAMSGGNAPTDVKLAVAALWRAMEKHSLTPHPKEDGIKQKQK